MRKVLFSILLLVSAALVSAQTQAPYTHPGKVQIRSTSSDALVVFGGGVFGVSTDPSAQQLDVRSAGDDLGGGMRISRADGSYFILNMDDGGSTAWATLQAGDGGTFRPIKLNPSGGQTLIPDGSLAAPSLAFINDTTTGLEKASSGLTIIAQGVRTAQILNDRLFVADRAAGAGVKGPFLFVGRNSSGTGAPGAIAMADKSNIAWVTWFDTSGNLRVSSAAPVEGASDTVGTVIGTQTSTRASKNILGQVNGYAPAAMDLIRKTPIWAFTYRNGAYNGETFYGITTDDSPLFGMDGGKSFNPVNAFGASVLALQDVDRRVQDLEARLAAALATIETLKKREP